MKKRERKADLRVVRTLHALNEAFLQILSKKSVSEITVNELCQGAGIRRATFYKHFAGKAEFVDYSIRHMHKKFAKNAESQLGVDDLPGFYLEYARETLAFLRANDSLLKRMQETNMLPTLLSILTEEAIADICRRLVAAEAKGTVLPARREVLASFYIGGLYQALYQKLRTGDSTSDEEYLAELTYMLRNA